MSINLLAEMLESSKSRQETIDVINAEQFQGHDRDIFLAMQKAHAADPDFDGVAPICEHLRGNQPAMARAMQLVMQKTMENISKNR